MSTSLVTRNVRIGRKRTSVRLEPNLWRALETVADDNNETVNTICSRVAALKPEEGGFTSALRVFIVDELFARAFPTDAATAHAVDEAEPIKTIGGASLMAATTRRRAAAAEDLHEPPLRRQSSGAAL